MKNGLRLAEMESERAGVGVGPGRCLAPIAVALGLAGIPNLALAAEKRDGQPCGGTVICASERWNDTGIDVLVGEALNFRVSGVWYDRKEESTSTGYHKPLFVPVAWLRRYPHAKWFALIACVERTRRCTPIQPDRPFVPEASGRLYMYANDLWPMYFNNSGYLTVEQVSD